MFHYMARGRRQNHTAQAVAEQDAAADGGGQLNRPPSQVVAGRSNWRHEEAQRHGAAPQQGDRVRIENYQGNDQNAGAQRQGHYLDGLEARGCRDRNQAPDGEGQPEPGGEVSRLGGVRSFERYGVGKDPVAKGHFSSDVKEQEEHARNNHQQGAGDVLMAVRDI